MSFSVTLPGASLAAAAHWAAGLTPRQASSQPALSGILLVADDFAGDSTLTLSATDEHQNTSGRIEAANPTVTGSGRRLVSGRLLDAIARTVAKEDQVTLVDNDDDRRLDVRVGVGAGWSLPLMPAEDYPPLPELVPAVARVDAAAFSRAVGRVSLALSEPALPPFFGGFVLDGTDDTLSVVAGSSYRLAVADLDWTLLDSGLAAPGMAPVLVPAPVLSAAMTAARDADGDAAVTLHSDGKGTIFAVSGPGYHVTGRVGGEVPTWRGGDLATRLDQRFGHVDIAVEDFRTALDRVGVVMDVKESIVVEVCEEWIEVSSSASIKGAATHHVEVLDFDGERCKFALKLDYTRDMVACLNVEKVRLEFVGKPRAPRILARAVDDAGEVVGDVRMSLAPVKLPAAAKAAA